MLLTTQAQTFNTPVENNYNATLQDVANLTLRTIAKFMPYVDIVSMVGLKEDFAITDFKGSELDKIQKVKILTGNALSKSPAGRLAIAQDMMNSGQISPTQYTEVVETGTLKDRTEDITAQDALIQYENQQMIQGNEVPVLLLDNPLKHIQGHMIILTHPDVRNDTQKQEIIMKHITEHQQNWTVLGVQNPQLLALITGSPIPPDVPEQGVVQGGQQPQQPPTHPQAPQQPPHKAPMMSGIGKNNMANASTPGGQNDLAASALRSASRLLHK